ncbi:hypothetical protein B0H14DRAFT_3437711 [Mycena olivaceomarginata]|nr:hypothetical protein B0H14DRAFT_3437711 [Mycena olivaceomarginata]
MPWRPVILPSLPPHYAGFSAHVRRTFPQWVISPTAVTNDDLRPTHLPYAIHRQRACKTQYISKRGPPLIGSAFVSFAIL